MGLKFLNQEMSTRKNKLAKINLKPVEEIFKFSGTKEQGMIFGAEDFFSELEHHEDKAIASGGVSLAVLSRDSLQQALHNIKKHKIT